MNKTAFQVLSICLVLFLTSCAGTGGGLGSIAKSNELRPGMSTQEVELTLGKPLQTHFVSNKWVWKYKLHQYWKGYVPYYLVFNKDSQKLEEWYANEAEYMRNQHLWLQAFPPTQKHEITIK